MAERRKRRSRSSPADGAPGLVIRDATPSRWRDLAVLFGPRGACGGCWCMAWRRRAAAFAAGKGASNRRALRRVVASGEKPGVIGYLGREPVAWCAVAPRARYPRLEASRVLRPVDDREVWSVSCLFVRKDLRRQGLSSRMIEGAVRLAGKGGATVVEGYPVVPSPGGSPDPFLWTGTLSAFEEAGFVEVARRSPTRPIVRRELR